MPGEGLGNASKAHCRQTRLVIGHQVEQIPHLGTFLALGGLIRLRLDR